MRVIFDLGHPAHFHLFKNVISHLKGGDNDIIIAIREKSCLAELLENESWDYYAVKKRGNGLLPLCIEAFKSIKLINRVVKQNPVDLIVGPSIGGAIVGRLKGITSIVFSEDDATVVPLFSKIAYPFAHYIVTPQCLAFENYGKKHLTYRGYHELAYLHPNRFIPDESIFGELGLKKGQRYFLIRLVSLSAHHDIGAKGVSTEQARFLVEHLSSYGRVFISAEKTVDEEMKKYLLPTRVERIFDVMTFADMVIGDSQTMIAEAAVLGTPALRCNSFVDRISYLEELEHKYGLAFGFKPREFQQMLSKIDQLLSEPDIKKKWQAKRQKMLNDCVDLTAWMVDLFRNFNKK